MIRHRAEPRAGEMEERLRAEGRGEGLESRGGGGPGPTQKWLFAPCKLGTDLAE